MLTVTKLKNKNALKVTCRNKLFGSLNLKLRIRAFIDSQYYQDRENIPRKILFVFKYAAEGQHAKINFKIVLGYNLSVCVFSYSFMRQ